jgi:DNA-binding transcriptional MerR regulator
MPQLERTEIPNRSLFRQPEVCDLAQIQPYVLRTWEAEFPDLGIAKTEGGPRVYRRADVERVLRIKHMLFVEGLTLAGARRKLLDEQPQIEPKTALSELTELLGSDARERILLVRQGLRELAAILAKSPGAALEEGFQLSNLQPMRVRPKPRIVKPAKSKKKR